MIPLCLGSASARAGYAICRQQRGAAPAITTTSCDLCNDPRTAMTPGPREVGRPVPCRVLVELRLLDGAG